MLSGEFRTCAHQAFVRDRFGPDTEAELRNLKAAELKPRCLAAGVPLVESGTEGYIGQARAIIKGDDTGFKGFKCYECDPPRKTESYPICTIRNHPDKPVHCIAWAKAPRSSLPAA